MKYDVTDKQLVEMLTKLDTRLLAAVCEYPEHSGERLTLIHLRACMEPSRVRLHAAEVADGLWRALQGLQRKFGKIPKKYALLREGRELLLAWYTERVYEPVPSLTPPWLARRPKRERRKPRMPSMPEPTLRLISRRVAPPKRKALRAAARAAQAFDIFRSQLWPAQQCTAFTHEQITAYVHLNLGSSNVEPLKILPTGVSEAKLLSLALSAGTVVRTRLPPWFAVIPVIHHASSVTLLRPPKTAWQILCQNCHSNVVEQIHQAHARHIEEWSLEQPPPGRLVRSLLRRTTEPALVFE